MGRPQKGVVPEHLKKHLFQKGQPRPVKGSGKPKKKLHEKSPEEQAKVRAFFAKKKAEGPKPKSEKAIEKHLKNLKKDRSVNKDGKPRKIRSDTGKKRR